MVKKLKRGLSKFKVKIRPAKGKFFGSTKTTSIVIAKNKTQAETKALKKLNDKLNQTIGRKFLGIRTGKGDIEFTTRKIKSV